MKKSEIYKIRYAIYRDLGYSAKESRALRSKALDVSPIRLDKEGALSKNRAYRSIVNSITGPKDIDKFARKFKRTKNDSVYTKWGMFTHDERFRDQTAKFVDFVKKEHDLSNDQAYSFFYYMTQGKMTYKQAKEELLSGIDFEKNLSPKGKPKK
jgi:hypothetical protein